MIIPTFPGAKNSASEIVPPFIRTKAAIAAWVPTMAPKSCCIAGDGSSAASLQVNSYIGRT
jgi:hypothetical protein